MLPVCYPLPRSVLPSAPPPPLKDLELRDGIGLSGRSVTAVEDKTRLRPRLPSRETPFRLLGCPNVTWSHNRRWASKLSGILMLAMIGGVLVLRAQLISSHRSQLAGQLHLPGRRRSRLSGLERRDGEHHRATEGGPALADADRTVPVAHGEGRQGEARERIGRASTAATTSRKTSSKALTSPSPRRPAPGGSSSGGGTVARDMARSARSR